MHLIGRFYLLLLLLLIATSCSNNDDIEPDKPTCEIEYFFDPSHPESCHYIFSMSKSTDGSIVFSAFTNESQNTDLFKFENKKIEKIDPEIYFSGCRTYQYEKIVLYEKNNLLIKFDPDEKSEDRWMVTDMNDRGHSSTFQKDEQGNIWIASRNSASYEDFRNGFLMYDGSEWREFVTEYHIWSLCFDKLGNLYANTLPVPYTASEELGVILKYDHVKWGQIATVGYITIDKEDPVPGKPIEPERYYFPTAWFKSLHIDSNNNLWAGSLQRSAIGTDYGCGLYKMTLDGEVLEHYHTLKNSKIPSNSVTEVRIDSQNNVWISTYGSGLSKLLPNGEWETYPFSEIYNEDEQANVECFLIDNDKIYGSLWSLYGLFEMRLKSW